uniref:Uncharacterized protein LOC111133424 n=1 Tax=Crassostrea virginica TaxID=6565 RepID=A0A8B8ED07_CRAVI|nr:uncharacterized protein LOC111133424 [Crassostrea virginica]
MALKTILTLLAFLVISVVQGDLTCSSDDDCALIGYHCCHGSIYCCPDGYICTGTLTCISIGVIVGPVVGGIVLIVSCVVCCVCYRRRRNRLPATVGYGQQPQVTVSSGQQVSYSHPQAYGQSQGYGQPPVAYPQSGPVKQ